MFAFSRTFTDYSVTTMRRRIYLYLALLLLSLVAVGLWFYNSRSWSDAAQHVNLLPPRDQLLELNLVRGQDTLNLVREAGRWREKRTQRQATENSIQTLLDYFQRIEVRFPISGDVTDVVRNLRDSGLQVTLRTPETTQNFILGSNTAGELVLAYNNNYYLVRTAGFARSTIYDLALSVDAWTERSLTIRRPSDLQTIWLMWPNDARNSFCVQVRDSLHVALLDLEQCHELVYDTVRMSAFLYALTTLELDGNADTISRATQTLLRDAAYLVSLRLLLRGEKDTLAYKLFRAQSVYSSAKRELGYLLVNDTAVRTTPLVSWDAVLTTLGEIKK